MISVKVFATLLASTYLAIMISSPRDLLYMPFGAVVLISVTAVIQFSVLASKKICRDFQITRRFGDVALSGSIIFFPVFFAQVFLSPPNLIIDGVTITKGNSITAQGALLAVKDAILVALAVVVREVALAVGVKLRGLSREESA